MFTVPYWFLTQKVDRKKKGDHKPKMGKKRKFQVEQKEENEYSLPAKFLSTSHIRSHEKRLVIVLEGAQLETVKVRIALDVKLNKIDFIIIFLFYRLATHLNY